MFSEGLVEWEKKSVLLSTANQGLFKTIIQLASNQSLSPAKGNLPL